MKYETLKAKLKTHYSISPQRIEPIGTIYTRVAVFKVSTDQNTFCLKPSGSNAQRFRFLVKSLETLQNLHYPHSPILYPTNDGQFGFCHQSKWYYLTDWYDGSPCRFTKFDDIEKVVQAVAKLHFLTKPYANGSSAHIRLGSQQLKRIFKRHHTFLKEANRLKSLQTSNSHISWFVKNLDQPIADSLKAISYLEEFLTPRKQLDFLSLCHNDLTVFNCLIDRDGEVKLIDFDRCTIGCSIHDFSFFLANTLDWSWDRMQYAINQYGAILPWSDLSLQILYAFLLLPKEFWHLTSKYYRSLILRNERIPDSTVKFSKQTVRSQPAKHACLSQLYQTFEA
jgi:CotS family spore coat protein